MSGRVVLESQSRECGPPVNQVELSAGGCASAVDKTRFLVGCANGAFLAAGVLGECRGLAPRCDVAHPPETPKKWRESKRSKQGAFVLFSHDDDASLVVVAILVWLWCVLQ